MRRERGAEGRGGALADTTNLLSPRVRLDGPGAKQQAGPSRDERCWLTELPDEVLVEVFERLDVVNVCMLARACAQTARVAACPRVWQTRTIKLVVAPMGAWSGMARNFACVQTLKVEPAKVYGEWPGGSGSRLQHAASSAKARHSVHARLPARCLLLPLPCSCSPLLPSLSSSRNNSTPLSHALPCCRQSASLSS
ncbi:hypothetical protein T492DRAFT_922177 [Pavlovales sp. CCMP2436]|nr:hypothetical protein T492DRAFT_922177 [Pavlovales sp. CCMP2436]|mmetsp:Transcript_36673/g.91415  ORF Transcript_36673/g.91415 Transcript_36673/m.91415 type:complete len:196 (-) Transcript_36673:855-1442(-)